MNPFEILKVIGFVYVGIFLLAGIIKIFTVVILDIALSLTQEEKQILDRSKYFFSKHLEKEMYENSENEKVKFIGSIAYSCQNIYLSVIKALPVFLIVTVAVVIIWVIIQILST